MVLTPRDVPSTKISVITATLNAVELLPRLLDSLDAQTVANFEWIIMDGGSRDGTVELVTELARSRSWIRFHSEPDFGFYDALNKSIRRAAAPFYVVSGADDVFSADAMENYQRYIADGAVDLVLADVMIHGRRCGGFFPDKAWLGSARVFRGSHSVGMAIRTSLHSRFGYYSHRFPLLADSLFLKKLLAAPEVRVHTADFVAGEFAKGGMTTTNKVQILAETWQIQMLTERHPVLQTLLFLGKLCCRMPGVIGELRRGRDSSS